MDFPGRMDRDGQQLEEPPAGLWVGGGGWEEPPPPTLAYEIFFRSKLKQARFLTMPSDAKVKANTKIAEDLLKVSSH
jgi:hypothetical protein